MTVTLRRLWLEERWYVCQTRPRAEKQVNRMLKLRGVEGYLPLLAQVRQWTDRKKRVEFPLFPGYVFARFGPEQMHQVLLAPGVVTIVRSGGAPVPVREEELESVRILLACANAGHPPPQPVEFVELGHEVLVRDGPFSGVRGMVIEDRGRTRVVVCLRALKRALSVELPRGMLRAVGQ